MKTGKSTFSTRLQFSREINLNSDDHVFSMQFSGLYFTSVCVVLTRYDARCMLDGIDGGQVEGDVILTRFPWVL